MKLKKIQEDVFLGIKMTVYEWGEFRILQSIDNIETEQMVYENFGTRKLPVGKYKHTSISHPTRYPTWEELKEVKQLMHGDKFVFQAMPPKAFYTNVHENCFHLWEIL